MSWDIVELLSDLFRNSFLITGLVVVMMIMIEYINVSSSGRWFDRLKDSKFKQVVLGSFLGLIPGCVGGFAAVSLYSHGLISFGALVAAMISSSGDESFVMLAMIPKEAVILFVLIFIIAILFGIVVDKFYKGNKFLVNHEFEVHDEHIHSSGLPSLFQPSSYKVWKRPSKERIILVVGLILFIVALFSGLLEHEHGGGVHEHADHSHGINLLDERWINLLFASLSVVVLLLIAASGDHFIKEHIWNHVIKKHCLSIFLWTFGALAVIHIGLHFVDISEWLDSNTFYVILIAALVGLIPESGPHLVFVTLFAGGYVPFSVLLASSISQDGHTALPLLASDKGSFLKAKIINAAVAIVVATAAMWIGF